MEQAGRYRVEVTRNGTVLENRTMTDAEIRERWPAFRTLRFRTENQPVPVDDLGTMVQVQADDQTDHNH